MPSAFAVFGLITNSLCVPKTLSALIGRRNHLTSVDHVRIIRAQFPLPSSTHIVRHRTGLPEPVDEHALVRRGLSLDAVETPVSQHGEPVFAEGR
jgi:hypothetical protein